jgi:hypothetical protein
MTQSGLKLIISPRRKQRVRLNRKRALEARFREDYKNASEDLEAVIAMHLPGRIQGAYDRYMSAARRLERFFHAGRKQPSGTRLRAV